MQNLCRGHHELAVDAPPVTGSPLGELWLSDGLAESYPRRRSRCASCRSRRWLSGLLSCSRAGLVIRCPCGLRRSVRMRSTMVVAMAVSFLSWIFVPAARRTPESG